MNFFAARMTANNFANRPAFAAIVPATSAPMPYAASLSWMR